MPKKKELETCELKDIEIFSAGTWNGDIYTEQDIESLVSAFEKTKEKVKPFLKLGHNNSQELLESDGLPAAGWISGLRKVGEKLVADFIGVPKAIYELITAGAYRTVSSEIYWNFGLDGEKYPYLLKAVALLGADIPAVSNLKDIMSLYAKGEPALAYDATGIEVKTYEVKITEDKEMEKELEMLREKLANSEKLFADEKAAYAIEKEGLTKSFEEMKGKCDEMKLKCDDLTMKCDEWGKKYSIIAEEKRTSEINNKIDELISAKKVLPAQKEALFALLKNIPKEAKYTADGKEESLDELVVKFAEAYQPVSLPEKPEANGKQPEKKEFNSADDELHCAINKYMADNKVSYTKAYEAITRERRTKAAEGKTE